MEMPQPSALAQFAPVLRVERFDEVVQYDDAMEARPPQRTYEKLWQGTCGPDITVEEGDEIVRPFRLRVRWLQNGDAALRWQSIEVTSRVVLPDEGLGHLPVRTIWTRHHASRKEVPDFFLQFVSANPPAPRTAG
ncbi:hypothetical protein [Streptomyces anthocyanicus]|uniref:hypothetical protein n=1 Tax=Streptomyces anthocyanicus TaxID=68174 RepID=UPI00381E4747